MKIDDTDLQILNFLQHDGKMTQKEIGANLKLSTTAVYERIKRLERNGYIRRYVALIDKEKLGYGLTAFCYVSLSSHSKKYLLSFQQEILNLKEVTECFHIAGEYDYILKVVVSDMNAYRDFIVNKLTILDHISNAQTVFVMDEVKSETAFYFQGSEK